MSTEQNYAPRESYAIAIPPSAKKSPRITSRPCRRQTPIPVDLAIELWRPVVGFEKKFQVSSKGRVRTFSSRTDSMPPQGNYLGLRLINTGYERTSLYDGGKQHHLLVHRLVAMTFIPNPLELPEVNHKDKNRRNNTWANLEWMTHQENIAHAIKGSPGFGHKQKVVSDRIAKCIIGDYYALPKQFTIRQLSTKYQLSIRAVSRVLRQNSKSSRHDQQTLEGIVRDYNARKGMGLTTDMIAQRYGLSVIAVRGIIRRANATALHPEFLTPQTPSSHE